MPFIAETSKQIRKNTKQIKNHKRDSILSCLDSTSPSISLQYEVSSRRASATVMYEENPSESEHLISISQESNQSALNSSNSSASYQND